MGRRSRLRAGRGTARAGRARAVRRARQRPTRAGRRRALRRQGRQPQHRRMGTRGRGVRVAARVPHGRVRTRTASGAARPRGRAPRVPEPPSDQPRRQGHPGPRSLVVAATRRSGQGARANTSAQRSSRSPRPCSRPKANVPPPRAPPHRRPGAADLRLRRERRGIRVSARVLRPAFRMHRLRPTRYRALTASAPPDIDRTARARCDAGPRRSACRSCACLRRLDGRDGGAGAGDPLSRACARPGARVHNDRSCAGPPPSFAGGAASRGTLAIEPGPGDRGRAPILFSQGFRRAQPERVDEALAVFHRDRPEWQTVISLLAASAAAQHVPPAAADQRADARPPRRARRARAGRQRHVLAREIPNADLAIIEGAGHAYLLERPDESLQALLEWTRRRRR